jgi:hypothetical protein
VGLSTLAGRNQPPPSPQTIADQHRFEVGCQAEDAQGYEGSMPYCGHHGGHIHP